MDDFDAGGGDFVLGGLFGLALGDASALAAVEADPFAFLTSEEDFDPAFFTAFGDVGGDFFALLVDFLGSSLDFPFVCFRSVSDVGRAK